MKYLASSVKRLFLGLKWYETSEYALLMMLAVTIPIQWRIALWCLILLCANTFAKTIYQYRQPQGTDRQRRFQTNPALSRPIRACLWAMVFYYLLYAVSGIYSNNPSEALSTIQTMLPLLLFPLIFLFGDTRYLTRRHLSLLTFLLAATLTIRFILILIRSGFHSIDSQLFSGTTHLFATLIAQLASWFSQITPFSQLNDLIAIQPLRAIAHLFNNTPFEYLKAYTFDPLHHNYLALYLLTAIALLYTELVRHWKACRWHCLRWFVIVDIILLSAYILLCGSRSGMVAWGLLVTACFLHLALAQHQWRTLGIILAVMVILIGITYLASPKTYTRVTDTAKLLLRGEEGDIRQTMWLSGLQTIKDRPIWGYGCDGYWDALKHQYREHDCLTASSYQFSPHNQYLETTLATGLVGLVAMLAMILLPVWFSLHRRHRNLPMILFTVAYETCIFFEASFGRQMGLLFIGFWYCILLHYSRPAPVPMETA